jgi:hypothetical protein
MRFPRTCLLRKMSSFRRQWYTMSSATEIWSSDDDDDSSSFRSCLFLFLFLLIVDTIQRQNSERQSTHKHTHIHIHSLWTLALLPPTMINLLLCSNISLSIPRMCNNASYISGGGLFFFLFLIYCKESDRVCIYLRCATDECISWKWMTIL